MIGKTLGHYAIDSELGAGGMGVVYKGRDTRLGRSVAIKVVRDELLLDEAWLSRFEREARVLASLNHPNIAAIYGFEEVHAARFLVLEFVSGRTLAELVRAGPLAVKEALGVCMEIAAAVEAAHEKGVIHRDLKPANIKVTDDGTVKVLDFGLAKTQREGADPDQATQSVGTAQGVILGTPAYMSPEQACAKPLDARTDIWSFGCILYELLAGKRAFSGGTLTEVLAGVLERDPDWQALPAAVPPSVRRLVQRCLQKDPRKRLRDIGDARIELEEALSGKSGEAAAVALATAPSHRVAPVVVAAGVALITALVMWILVRPALQAPVLPSRFAIVPPPAQQLAMSDLDRVLALSPDGRHLVYRALGSAAGGPLMLRAIDQLDAQPLSGITNARQPFFSADSRWIGFIDGTELKKVSITGGPAITVCRLNAPNPRGASWGDDDTIVFATNDATTGLLRVSAGGGEPTVLTKPDAAQREADHLFPSVLPGGRGVLFTITVPNRTQDAQVAVLDLKTGQRKTLVRGGSQAEYVDTGHLIYAAASVLRAVRFDLARLEVLSEPVPVVEHVMVASTGAVNYAVSRPGTLVYVPGGAGAQATPRSLVWIDRKGNEAPIKAPLRAYNVPRLSPDSTRVAVEIRDQDNDLWIWDLARETLTRLTLSPGVDEQPVWTPEGRRIIFASARAGVSNLYGQAADGTGTVERLTTSADPQFPNSITPDGRGVVGYENSPKTAFDVVLFPLVGPASSSFPPPSLLGPSSVPGRRVEPLVQTAAIELNAEVSPEGRYLAYQSSESGAFEIYVRPFPQVDGGRWQVSNGGGTRPVWARRGRELFYLDGANTLTAVEVQTAGPTFSAGNPAKVFNTQYAVPALLRPYDVSPDGQRFLMIKDSAAGDPNVTPASLVVVLNWFEELKARVPVGK